MIDSIVIYPMEPFLLDLGLNVIGCERPDLLYRFIAGLQGNDEEIVLGNGDRIVDVAKAIVYVGDCADAIDYDSLFQKTAIKKVVESFSPERLSRVLALQTEMRTIIQDEIWSEDLPLEVSATLDLKSAVSMVKPRIDTSSLGSLFDKIQLVVDTAGALAESKTLVTLHIIQYCDNDQLIYLHKELLRHHLQLLDLECCSKKAILAEGRSHYVDKDYVQFS
ncbi:type II-A CRISPR-associated protein Csn2 [Bifidobacterium dentium]|mgnify:FL=1|uniref:type II-A CRISPR-associated protein Csn2 n=1 Tax=Bifidobacterium dentium TaxID=1689 RepID=UPI0026DC9662|nr:type II-A CRISPR-associated protein Csn2 [Bifidobacterium dentium]